MAGDNSGDMLIQPIRVLDSTIEPSRKESIFKLIFRSILANSEQLLDAMMQASIRHLTQTSELKLWQKVDRHGKSHWYARHPNTGKTISFVSDLEMRRWVDSYSNLDRW